MAESPDRMHHLAQLLGAHQEAAQLNSVVVGTEHLLLAALVEPEVRHALSGVGCVLPDLHRAVVTISGHREPCFGDDRVEVTPEVAIVLVRVATRIPELESTAPASRQVVLLALRTVVIELLVQEWDCAARRALAELDLTRHTPNLIASLEPTGAPPNVPDLGWEAFTPEDA